LERGLGHRQARDFDRLASQGFQVVLEMEVASWSATNSCQHPQTHRTNGTRESDLGPSARGLGAFGEVGHLCFSTHSARLLALQNRSDEAAGGLLRGTGGRLFAITPSPSSLAISWS